MTETTEEKSIPLEPRLSVNVLQNGTYVNKELFMSAGLERRLAALAGQGDDFARMYVDPVMQEFMLLEMLTPRTPRGQVPDFENQLTLEDYGLSPEDADAMINWAAEHVLNFFTKVAKKLEVLAADPQKSLSKLMASVNGLQALAAQKQSAGDSTPKSVT